jgi:tetraprenyl-beta-curcumene synthase
MTATSRIALASDFVMAATHYWLNVFPCICRESRRWRLRAQQIPDPELRRLALEAQHVKRGNIEGSAAFAAFAPRAQRAAVVRAQVAFQSAYDYVDTLAEQPSNNPIGNARQLHRSLLTALDPDALHPDYYAHCPRSSDAGYLKEIVDACRSALYELPSRASIAAPAHRLTQRIVTYQSFNLSEPHGGHGKLAPWARMETPRDARLRWWETAASAGSSLGIFALLAAAAKPSLSALNAVAIEQAYWPWIGALHSLLDSLIDEPEDRAADQRSLLDYYSTPQEAATRLQLLAAEAFHAIGPLPNCNEHAMVLAGMASHYLTAPEASSPTARLASRGVTDTMGALAKPSMFVLRTRRAVSCVAPRPCGR